MNPVEHPATPRVAVLIRRPDIVARAIKTALVVGTILIAINHGPALIEGDLGLKRILQIALTYCVPYSVATYASVQAIRGERVGASALSAQTTAAAKAAAAASSR